MQARIGELFEAIITATMGLASVTAVLSRDGRVIEPLNIAQWR